MEEVIKVNHLTKDYKQGKGIFDFNFSIKEGEVVGLVGTNGSGKTTTMRHLMGFLKPHAGNAKILGLNTWKYAHEIKHHVGYVPGEIDFPDVGTGTHFLKIQAELLGMKDYSYMNHLIDVFKIDVTAPLRRMSKGMKQKTALVAAFMSQPDIFLLDEPSTGLDPMMRNALIEVILEQKKQGKTIFISSHVFVELEAICDRVLFIHNGHLIDEVKRDSYSPSKAKEFKVGFMEPEDYQKFLKSGFDVVRKNDQYLHCNIRIEEEKMDLLFKELVNYPVRYINKVPYTLEWYYDNYVVPMEQKA